VNLPYERRECGVGQDDPYHKRVRGDGIVVSIFSRSFGVIQHKSKKELTLRLGEEVFVGELQGQKKREVYVRLQCQITLDLWMLRTNPIRN